MTDKEIKAFNSTHNMLLADRELLSLVSKKSDLPSGALGNGPSLGDLVDWAMRNPLQVKSIQFELNEERRIAFDNASRELDG